MAADLPIDQVMVNLTIDPYMNPNLGHMKNVHGTPCDAISWISSIGASGSVKEGELDYEPMVMPYSPNNYSGYDYPGYGGYLGVTDDQGYCVSGDGLEMQYPVMVADNGSLVYFVPEPGYNPYSSYYPMATMSVDGQYVVQQPSIAPHGYFPTNISYGSELVPASYVWNPSYHVGDGVYASGYTKVSDTPSSKPNIYASTHTLAPSNPTYEHRNALENKGASTVPDNSSGYGAHNQLKGLSKPVQHGSTFKPDYIQTKGSLPFTRFPSYHQSKGGLLYPNSSVSIKANGRSCIGYENLKPRSNKTNDINDAALLNEHNNGPRTGNYKNASISTDDTVTSVDADGSISLVRPEHYNLPDFVTNYSHAFFFVIKSYSEDDIHKSIKYNVWASTPNGNKRLDCAYQEAQKKMEEKGCKCPVFLFFSVNASGQFCGVAEMLGRVDHNKSMDFWQQDKWSGYFSVKWHMIKDVPNPQLRHIILENNENKPVTNSRDTQEVRFAHGIEILNIYKNYASKTSILDDFEFYESRQKVMQEKRIRPSTFRFNAVQQKTNELNRGFQMTDVSSAATKKIDEIQVGDKASK